MRPLDACPKPGLLLSFDFDGTIHDPAESPPVPTSFFDEIRRLRETHGAVWGINTGRSMPQVIEGGYLYIAQPPLYKVARGKSEVYLKDQAAFEDYLIAMGLEGAVLRLGSGEEIAGADLATKAPGCPDQQCREGRRQPRLQPPPREDHEWHIEVQQRGGAEREGVSAPLAPGSILGFVGRKGASVPTTPPNNRARRAQRRAGSLNWHSVPTSVEDTPTAGGHPISPCPGTRRDPDPAAGA